MRKPDCAGGAGLTGTLDQGPISDGDLGDLIAVSADLGLVPRGVDELPHSVVHWRDDGPLPHTDIEVWKEEARIAIEVLHKIHRWLS